MEEFEYIYEQNKKLDKMFIKKYNHDDLVRKNKIELLVEIGELANETKCFKYWSSKKPNMELVELEYADCLIMTFCFFNLLNINLSEDFSYVEDLDIIDSFAKIYSLASSFYYLEDKDTIKLLFVYLLNLGYKLGFTNDDIRRMSEEKIKRDMDRFKENY